MCESPLTFQMLLLFTCHIFPEGNGQKFKLASVVFSKLARA